MDDHLIQAHYELLLIENAQLRAEVKRLNQLLGQNNTLGKLGSIDPVIDQKSISLVHPSIDSEICTEHISSLDRYSPANHKIAFFMKLFSGRSDIYAKRWYSMSNKKSGYSPVCVNQWKTKICHKGQNKCSTCPYRVHEPLNTQAIDKHLRGQDEYGRDVIGIYPLLANENTHFFAVDFDGDDWKQDITAFRHTCSETGVSIAVERSRSGNGAHVWCFFRSPVSATLARKLGNLLLTETMNRRHEIHFKSYDRLFPNQDKMPTGGFGNLIALPLQGQARRHGNSVFIDENFQAYSDQWAFLSGIKKMDISEIEHVINILSHVGEIGTLLDVSDDVEKPWIKKPEPLPLTSSDFPDKVHIVLSNAIYIHKSGFSQRALNCIKRLAAFRNPDFYKTLAMRLPVWDKPRIISLDTETKEYMIIPRGCLVYFNDFMKKHHIKYELLDHRQSGKSLKITFNGTLRSEQQEAVNSLLQNEDGVLSATTAFGKTVIGAYLIGTLKVNTLILVHSTALLAQWKDSLEHFLSLDDSDPDGIVSPSDLNNFSFFVGQLGGRKHSLTGIIDIAVMQSLSEGDEVKDLVKDYGMIIVDECHHVPAMTFDRILGSLSARYIYGLTATPIRKDGRHPIIFMRCGPIRYKVDARQQAAKRSFEHFMIPRFTRFRLKESDQDNYHITDIYKEICVNDSRNNKIINDTVQLINNECRNVILLTERTAHADYLTAELQKILKNVIELTGTLSPGERANRMALLHEIPSTESVVLVATGKYIGEGFDLPRLDTLMLTMPISWKGILAQYVGRLHRECKGKQEVRVYDYVDIHVQMLDRMYQKRVKGYKELGYQIKMNTEGTDKIGVIFDNQSFLPVFNDDIKFVRSEIIIISPYLRRYRVECFINQILPVLERGVKVMVVTRPGSNYHPVDPELANLQKILIRTGIEVRTVYGIHQKYAIFDKNVVWYGSINFLSYGKSEETVMRFENRELAGELLTIMTDLKE